MDELHRIADKLRRELEILDLMEWNESREPTDEQVTLRLQQAKRVRRESSALVQALARERDARS